MDKAKLDKLNKETSMRHQFRWKWDIINVICGIFMLSLGISNILLNKANYYSSITVGLLQLVIGFYIFMTLVSLLLDRVSINLMRHMSDFTSELLKDQLDLIHKLEEMVTEPKKKKTSN